MVDNCEYLESRSRSFNRLWPVAEDYVIKKGFILPVLEGKVVDPRTPIKSVKKESLYLPMGRPELPGEFARLADEDEEKVLAFVRRYGLLGYHCALRFPYEVISADKMKMYNYESPGDPLNWVFAHAKAVNLIMHLAEALNRPDELKIRLERLLVEEDLPSGQKRHFVSYLRPQRAFGLPGHARTSIELMGGYKKTAIHIITDIINENLTGIARNLEMEWKEEDNDYGIVSFFSFRNLMDCIYWLISDAIVGGKVRSCEYCGKPFTAPDDKTKYCPPLQWEKVSRCMNRAKQSRLRKKRKNNK
mgnify:CR=1 FL=1|jgi:hypothetical protein